MRRNFGLVLTAAVLAATASVQAGQFGPPTSIDDFGGNGPGAWTYGVSGANFDLSTVPGAIIGGAGSNTIKSVFLSGGPTNWQNVRHNEGDIAFAIGPFNPADAFLHPDPNSFIDNYAPAGPGPETESWRVNQANGGFFAAVRVNGHDNLDDAGVVYGISYFNSSFGQGNSYHP